MLDRARGGDRRALARLLTMTERGGRDLAAVAAASWPMRGSAQIVGLTGSPGAGKSTLSNALCAELRSRGATVGVLAVDPTSPYSGGAILGDRVRMEDHALDPGIFIRSMATRGHLGGLAVATPSAARVLDAAGFDPVVIETVGVGQVEVEIAGAADTTVVVVNPGWGDAVQAAKAGLMETADLFVINKADRPGAGETRRDLSASLEMAARGDWMPPIVDTIATDGTGVEELVDSIAEHRIWLEQSGEGARRREQSLTGELAAVLSAEVALRAEVLAVGSDFEVARESVVRGEMDPWTAAAELVESGLHRLLGPSSSGPPGVDES
ncbi:MAG: methylmalonyl Co-A mutase-associated GTPase MeaB [Microthrixaceae bacterium]